MGRNEVTQGDALMTTAKELTNLNVRPFPSDLKHRLKLEALMRKMDLNELVPLLLEQALKLKKAS